MCCFNGGIKLAALAHFEIVVDLFTYADEKGTHFMIYHRLYNNLFTFNYGQIRGGRVSSITLFKLQGQLYHFLPNILPYDARPKFLQLCFYDGALEGAVRSNYFKVLRLKIVGLSMSVVIGNPYAQFFFAPFMKFLYVENLRLKFSEILLLMNGCIMLQPQMKFLLIVFIVLVKLCI